MNNKNLSELEDVIGYSFTNKLLLRTALTHSSYVNENREDGGRDNERLEFFGDAIIEFHVSEYLFEKFRDLPEGDLTRTRASMVCEAGLAACAAQINLGDFILLGKGEEKTGGRTRPSVTSDAFEALVAAIYLDSGNESTVNFINEHLIACLEDRELFYDAKTRLQELVQRESSNVLTYVLIAEEGPVHCRQFVEAAYLNNKEIGRGSGHSKKEAQQKAALDAISRLSK